MLAHTIVKYEDSDPRAYLIFLHGILGTRANWRGIARKFVETRPEWGAILVDLREHGDSLGLAPPHTLEATARDVVGLERELQLPVHGVLGHSFGGKVALRWLSLRSGAAQCWLIDSSPGAKALDEGGSITGDVLAILEGIAPTWPSRDAFVDAVVSAGQSKPIGQ
ncbi:MAG: alpha/beta hydrolase, partial [Myxococcota bacterium]